ncbi:MAG: hypothetical protein A3B13_02470 [Candidatus Liptonbacteria bacterium RIFCSPLOWO2_01_FULL_45_15]|uniref:mRNA interferase n=2 Tax=Bacteria candidate phyla TaxID=1783234 RepID=A0A1F5NT46_9BACT|nr:MAG: hypothetical protein A2720_03175 [Candidatus Doudnabacteria bacterium RIFCSPHIGHO2_01_FULL_46_24]OGY98929.1 MAG: hypothetical protein A3B13_02470 [Candidatus Liptonbacteria bacterium RIFCSPLOWO2_01_FULL_45_15]
MKKGDICVIHLAAGIGHEQFGERPAILMSDSEAGVAMAIPLTTNREALRFHHTLAILPDKQNNLKQESVALIFHIRAVDKARILKIIGRVNKKYQEKIDKALREMLKL